MRRSSPSSRRRDARTLKGIWPLVSVVTVCRNSGATLERTIESVRAQTYPSVEHIIIDGGSTDSTSSIVKRHRRHLAAVISEPDRGISDAFNKGIARARGEFIHILNADDWFVPDTVARAVAALRSAPDAGFVYGDLVELDPATGKETHIPGDPDYSAWIRFTMGRLNHPTILARRIVYETHGGFDGERKLAMDYDWLLRIHRAGVRGIYDPSVQVRMTTGGVSSSARVRAFREVREISIRHGLPAPFAYSYFAARVLKHRLLQIAGNR